MEDEERTWNSRACRGFVLRRECDWFVFLQINLRLTSLVFLDIKVPNGGEGQPTEEAYRRVIPDLACSPKRPSK